MGRHRPTLDDGWWCAHLEVIGAGDEGRRAKSPQVGRFPFVQISDSHIGFNKGANPNVTGTLTKAIDRVNVVPAGMKAPDFMIHTGDITQNSKAEFDTAAQVIKSAEADEVFYVPGEHDFIDDGEQYRQRFGKGTQANGWYIPHAHDNIATGSREIAMNKTIYPLTSVRFFAASLVLIHHSVGIFLPAFSAKEAPLARGDIAGKLSLAFPVSVSFFFLLSGYVLSYVYLHDGQTVDKSKFFAARLARLYPLYFVMLILDTPKLLAEEVERHGMKLGLAMTGEIFAASMVLLQVSYPIKLAKINPPGWSLCVEAFFCLCFPVLGVLLWKLRGVQLWMTALLLYVGGQALVWWMRVRLCIGMTVTLPPTHLSTFALGILLARWQTLRRMQTDRPQVQAWHVNTVLWLAVGGILLSVWLIPFWQMPNPYFNGLLAPIYAAFIWALSVMPTLWSRWLCRRWLVALGNASYALYLIHYPLLNLFMHFRWVTPVCYLVYLGLCLAISLLSYRYFETPVRLWLLERFAAARKEPFVTIVSNARS